MKFVDDDDDDDDVTETKALAAVQKWVQFCTVWCRAETRPCRKAVSYLSEDSGTKHVLEWHSWDAVTRLSEQKTEKHEIQKLSCDGGLKADENWMSAET